MGRGVTHEWSGMCADQRDIYERRLCLRSCFPDNAMWLDEGKHEHALALAEELGLLAPAEEGALEPRLLQALLGSDWPASLRANLQRLQWAAGSVRGPVQVTVRVIASIVLRRKST